MAAKKAMTALAMAFEPADLNERS